MIVVVGDVIADIAVRPTGPIAHGTDTPSAIAVRRGGSAANVAVSLAGLGSPVRFVGAVGNDPFGDLLVIELQSAGVEAIVSRSVKPTGTIVVLIDHDGERSFLTQRGAGNDVTADESVLHGATWLHVPAYCLSADPLRTTATALLQLARERGVSTSIDCSSVSLIEEVGAEAFLGWVHDVQPTVVFANEQEGTALDVRESGLDSIVVVKHGANPVELMEPGREPQEFAVEPVDNVVDTTGAGDAFAAGFINAFQQRHGATGSVLAAVSVARSHLLARGM